MTTDDPRQPRNSRPIPPTVDEAIEQRMEDARRDRLDPVTGQDLNAIEGLPLQDELSVAEAFADKTANTLDLAAANILQRIRAIKERCERIERAMLTDIASVKNQIHATVELAASAERLAHSIDVELDRIVAARKTKLGG